MSVRPLIFAALAVWFATPLRAADEPTRPAAVFRVSSFSELIADIKYVATLENAQPTAKEMEDGLARFTGKDHGGIDVKRPAGVVAVPARNGTDLHPVGLIPVADEPLFLALVERHFGKPQKDKDGVYTVPSLWRIHFRFERRYAHVSTEAALLARERLLDPAKVLASDRAGSLVVEVHPDRMPQQYRDTGLQMLRSMLTNPRAANDPGETELQKKLRLQVVDSLARKLTAMVKEARELVLQFGIDRTADELFGEVTLSAQPGSQLARDLAGLGKLESRFAAGPSGDPAALRLLLHWNLPEALTEAVRPTVDESIRKVMVNAAAETERQQAIRLVEALDPTLRSGELNAGFHLYGPGKDQRYTLVTGFQVKQGMKIDQALRGLIKSLPERDRDKFKFNAARAPGGPVHRADVQHDFGERALAAFGSQPLYYAVRDDAVWLAVGPGALDAIKEAVAATPRAAPPLDYGMSFARLAPLLARDQKTAQDFVKLAEKTFGKAGSDRGRFVVEGGQTLRARVTMKADVLRFLSATEGRGRPFWFYWW